MFKNHIDYSQDLEEVILGACLLEKTAIARVYDLLEPKNFYKTVHGVIFESMLDMYKMSVPIDLLTLFDYLYNRKNITEIENYPTGWYLTKVTRDVVSTAHLEIHSHIIKQMWMQRELISITNGKIKLDGENVKEDIFNVSKAIQDINTGLFQKDWKDMSELMIELAKHQDKMLINEGKGLTTGIVKLDELNGGFFGGQMIIIGARPSVGKSAFMGQMAIAMAKQGKKVGIISLEMNNNEIAARLSSIETLTDFKTIYRNLFADENARARWYTQITDSFIGLEIYVTDNTKVSALDIKSKALKLKHQAKGLDCIFVDYLQLVDADEKSKFSNRENEIRQISRMVKLMAKDLDIPIIVLCQLNRQSTHRTGNNRYPQLSDLRESGSLEQDADVVMFLHRDWMLGVQEYMIDENGNSTKDKADLIVRKWRNGEPNLHIELEFEGAKMKFVEKGLSQYYPLENTEANENLKDNPF